MLKITGSLVITIALATPGISQAMDAAQLFGSKCSACHGPKGEGTQVGPALKGNPFITKGAPADIKKVIVAGRTEKEKKYPKMMNPMPGGLASEAEADALVIYLQDEMQK
ncbi:MAG: cytochrome c [Nitrospirae bacterium]|nr:cytochrome c [Nitrospirota bacterium]